jgi:hypothetical protein
MATAPSLLQSHRCYVDASITPDQPNQQPRMARLGIFILHLQDQSTKTLYIKTKLHACTFILMAEAAALALASTITANLNMTGTNFLSGYEQLVHFLNKEDLSDTPDWKIKPFTQMFSNHATYSAATIYKVHRSLNTTAHSPAQQVFQATDSREHFHFICSSEHHVPNVTVYKLYVT